MLKVSRAVVKFTGYLVAASAATVVALSPWHSDHCCHVVTEKVVEAGLAGLLIGLLVARQRLMSDPGGMLGPVLRDALAHEGNIGLVAGLCIGTAWGAFILITT
jgi:hypothetical protein